MSNDQQKRELNVFVSYSRVDIGFADQLVAALDAFGYHTTIDRRGIHGAENWQERLGNLILESDAVVFVLTRSSAESEICQWEVDQAAFLAKRIVPVLPGPLGDSDVPERLRTLNYIHFFTEPSVPGSGFGQGIARLNQALSVDVEWIREHTRLGELAARWVDNSRSVDSLVRGVELRQFLDWRARRPANAPELTDVQREFLLASEEEQLKRDNAERIQLEEMHKVQNAREEALKEAEAAQAAREAAMHKLSRRTISGLVAMGLLALVTGFAAWQTAIQKKVITAAELRLHTGMQLKIAKTQRVVNATEAWYKVATEYKLSLGIIRGGFDRATGFLIDGGALNDAWKERAMLMTAAHVFTGELGRKNAPREVLGSSEFSVRFPSLSNQRLHQFRDFVFFSGTLDVAVLEIDGEVSNYLVEVDLPLDGQEPEKVDGVSMLNWTGKDGFSLGFGHIIEAQHDFAGKGGRRYFYTHMSGGGSSGSPVFDTNTGKLLCMHQLGVSAQAENPWGACTSIVDIVAALKKGGG